MTENQIIKQLELEWRNALSDVVVPPEFAAGRPPRRYALYAMLDDARIQMQELHESGLPQEYAKRFVTSAWTVKDLLSHLASWAFELRREVQTIAANESFDYIIPWALSIMGPNQWNQAEVENRRSQDVSQAILEFDSEIKVVQDLILMLPDETLFTPNEFPEAPGGTPSSRWTGPLALMTASMTSHYRYHLQRLHQWLNSLPGVRP